MHAFVTVIQYFLKISAEKFPIERQILHSQDNISSLGKT